MRKFSNFSIGLLVGIGDGAQSKHHDIRLGDNALSTQSNGNGGVFEYSFVKGIQEYKIQYIRFLYKLPTTLQTGVMEFRPSTQ